MSGAAAYFVVGREIVVRLLLIHPGTLACGTCQKPAEHDDKARTSPHQNPPRMAPVIWEKAARRASAGVAFFPTWAGWAWPAPAS